MNEDEKIPDYLKKLSKGGPIKPDDGFGPEDVAWAGDDIDVEVSVVRVFGSRGRVI